MLFVSVLASGFDGRPLVYLLVQSTGTILREGDEEVIEEISGAHTVLTQFTVDSSCKDDVVTVRSMPSACASACVCA